MKRLLPLCLLLVACGGSTPLEMAKEECTPGSQYVTVGDGGRTLTIEGKGDEASGLSVARIVCIFDSLETSRAVISRMSNTRALDGMQDGKWDDFSASWTYHPDSGLNIIIEWGD